MPHQSTATGKKNPVGPVKSKPVTARNQPAKSGKSAPSGAGKIAANGEDRHNMIATAAYYRAERRGFNGGDETEDWLAAEAEIDAMSYH